MISIGKTSRQIRKTLLSPHFGNSIWNVVDVAIYPVVMILTLPLFISKLGDQQYGIWMLVNSFIASLGMANVGFGDATVRYVAKYRGDGDMRAIKGVIETTLSSYIILGIIIITVAFGLSALVDHYKWYSFVKIDEANHEIAILAFRIGSITFGMKLAEMIILSALRGFERYDRASQLSIGAKLLTLGLNITMVKMGHNLIQIFIDNAIMTFLTVVIEFFMLRRMVPKLSLWYRGTEGYFKEIMPYGFWTWLNSMMGILGGQMDRWIVNTIGGVATGGYYSNGAMLAERGTGLLASGMGFIFPIISRKSAKEEPLIKLYNKVQFVMATIGIFGGIAAYYLKDIVLGFAWKSKYAQTQPFMNGFIALVGVTSITIANHYFVMGSGDGKLAVRFRIIYFVCQIASISIALYFKDIILIPFMLTIAVIVAGSVHNYIIANQVLRTNPLTNMMKMLILSTSFAIFVSTESFQLQLVALSVVVTSWIVMFYKPVSYIFKSHN